MDLESIAKPGSILAFILAAVGGLLGWRSFSSVKSSNAAEARNSRFEERRDKELEETKTKLTQCQEALLASRDETARLRVRVRDQSIAIQNMLENLLESDPAQAREAERWVRDSTFAALDNKPAPKAPTTGRRFHR